ncbi:MAG TPA: hypothetical protein VMU83_07140 [Hanamia sp.]|nr:hypothetical protein [Hanamia sp.]
MKKYLILFAIIVTSFAVNAQNKSDKEPYLTRTFPSETINSVVSKTSGGNISVTAVNPSQSRVEVFVWQNGHWNNALSNDELKTKIANYYDLDISVNNGKLTATASPKDRITNWKGTLSFSFKIYVSENVSTKLETSGGNIVLTGLSGDQDFTTSGGNLDLNGLSGKVKGRTSGGNIYLQNCKNDLDLTTSGGNIDAQNSTGNITVTTSGGSIKLDKLSGNIKAQTSGGNIEGVTIDGILSAHTSGGNVSLLALNCSLKTSTSGGNIQVSVNKPGNYISISNSAGKVDLILPKNTGMDLKLSAMKISTENLENFSGNNSKDEINGTVNGGGIPVTVEVNGGKINLAFD